MKNLLSMLLVFSFLFTIGCEDDEATPDATLVGVWNMTSIEVVDGGQTITIGASSDYSLVMIFNEDGTYSLQGVLDGESYSESGGWIFTTLVEDEYTGRWYIVTSSDGGDELRITTYEYDEGTYMGSVSESWDYTLSGSSFSMSMSETDDNGDIWTYTYNFAKG